MAGCRYALKLTTMRKAEGEDAVWTAYAEGVNAGAWGDPKKANPYVPADRELYRAWRRGWAEGRRQENEAT